MNGSTSFDSDASSYRPHKDNYYVRDANGQIVFSYGCQYEPSIPNTYRLWEDSMDQITGTQLFLIIEYAVSLLNRFYDSNQSSSALIPNFLSNIISSTKISTSTIITGLILINRLKTLHPNSKGSDSSGHRLLLAALLLASKMIMDETYDNKSWANASAGLFDVEEVNQMEMEFLAFIDYQVFVSQSEWNEFTDAVLKEKR